MAVDMFLKLDGIPGEAQDDKHKGEIDVLNWSWGVSQSGTFHAGGGGGSGKANFRDLSVTKYVDIATPLLQLYAANGDHIKEGLLTVRKAGKTPLEYVKVTMKKILVTSISTGGSGGQDRLTETVTLNFASVDFTYTEQKAEGGAGSKKSLKWNIPANKQE